MTADTTAPANNSFAPFDAAGSLGATNLDYAIFERLLTAAFARLTLREDGVLQAGRPGWCALALAMPAFVYDNQDLRELAAGQVALTDGRTLFIDAEFLREMFNKRDHLASTTVLDHLERVYLTAARTAVDLDPAGACTVIETDTLVQALRQIVPDPDHALNAIGYNLSFNPVAQALAGAQSIKTSSEETRTFVPLATGLEDQWSQAIAAAPSRDVSSEDLPSMAGGLGALNWALSPGFVEAARAYSAQSAAQRQPFLAQVVENMDLLTPSGQAALVAMAFLAATGLHPDADKQAQAEEFGKGLIEQDGATQETRTSIINGLAFHTGGLIHLRLDELARAVISSTGQDSATPPTTRASSSGPRR